MKLAMGLLICSLMLAGGWEIEKAPSVAQVVALDECDPATFNAPTAARPDFCKNVAVGASTTFSTLFADAAAGHPDPKWDVEPDSMNVKEGTIVSVVNSGGNRILLPKWPSSAEGSSGLSMAAKRPSRNVRPASRAWPWPRLAFCRAASCNSSACRRANTCFSAASIPGCA